MPDGHRPRTSQVTAVDDQFGTHTLENLWLDAGPSACSPAGGTKPEPQRGPELLNRGANVGAKLGLWVTRVKADTRRLIQKIF